MQTHVVAKTAIFNDEGKVLILRRSADDPHRPGGSDFPGGKVDDGEEFVKGAIREIHEEAGLQLRPKDLELVYSYTKNGYNSEFKTDINFVWLGFVTKLPSGQSVALSFEHDSYEWLTLDKALESSDGTSLTNFFEHMRKYDIATELWKR
ncbi:MAG: NUDIX domain-containing protein [Candidatus Saccharimonadales bacterium]|jgi:8-oxo-dGTP pyrophosphatase MutT (NUDIX family)